MPSRVTSRHTPPMALTACGALKRFSKIECLKFFEKRFYIEDSAEQDVSSVIGKTDPSVQVSNKLNIYESYYIRGFSTSATDMTFNGLISDGDTAVDGEEHGMETGSVALDYQGERLRFAAVLIALVGDAPASGLAILLMGIAVGTVLSAVDAFLLIYLPSELSYNLSSWMAGSLFQANWSAITGFLPLFWSASLEFS